MYIEIEQEDDGRWIAEVPALPGAMAYGPTKEQAIARVETLVLRVLADKIEHGDSDSVVVRSGSPQSGAELVSPA